MKKIKDFTYGNLHLQKSKELEWNVLREDWNDRSIYVFNIFDNYTFRTGVMEASRKHFLNFKKFSKEVRSSIMYAFWSKSEYEVVVTSWPPYIDREEHERILKEFTENKKQIRCDANLCVAEKIDIADQIFLNWDKFIRYLWKNRFRLMKGKE